MADIEIVIKIPEGTYNLIMHNVQAQSAFENAFYAIRRGTPLPKGHGALKDADEVMKVMESNFDMQDLYLPIHFKQFALDEAQTIVEADKEVEE